MCTCSYFIASNNKHKQVGTCKELGARGHPICLVSASSPLHQTLIPPPFLSAPPLKLPYPDPWLSTSPGLPARLGGVTPPPTSSFAWLLWGVLLLLFSPTPWGGSSDSCTSPTALPARWRGGVITSTLPSSVVWLRGWHCLIPATCIFGTWTEAGVATTSPFFHPPHIVARTAAATLGPVQLLGFTPGLFGPSTSFSNHCWCIWVWHGSWFLLTAHLDLVQLSQAAGFAH